MRSTTIAVALAGVLALGLTGCGGGSAPATGPTGATPASNIVFIPGVTGDVFYTSMECGAKEAAAKAGAQLTVQGPAKFDPTLQKPVVDAVVASKPSAIIIAPTDAQAMRLPLQQAIDAKIPVVLVDTTLTDTSGTVAQVSSDNVEGGAKAFEAMQKLTPGGGTVLAIGNAPGVTTTDERLKGFAEAAAEDPKFTVLPAEYNQNDPARTAQIVSAAKQAHPDLVGVFATTQPAATGAATGINQLGAKGTVKLVAFDASPDLADSLRDGSIQALIAQQPAQMGADAIAIAEAAIDGDPGQGGAKTTGFTILTQDDVDTDAGRAAVYRTSCG
ncbi:ABC transporter substrate-binding protein [Pseudonocardia alni]|uniref:ABC transporter substrate-binding protein n=1 Tax=Pseudonocardia alni TaxID=33907 RepID=UPI0033C31E67